MGFPEKVTEATTSWHKKVKWRPEATTSWHKQQSGYPEEKRIIW
jgi:hypothetical protein